MVDTQLLGKKIAESGLKISKICEVLGISRTSWNKKMRGEAPFRIAEIYVLVDILKLTADERDRIFHK